MSKFKVKRILQYAKYAAIATGSSVKTILLMNRNHRNGVMRAPFLRGISLLECSKYARLAAERLSRAQYSPAPAWDLGEKNRVIRNIEGDLEKFVDDLVPGKSIVVFYNSWSRFNKENRIGTHAALYLGRERDIYLAEQYFLSQRAVPYSSLKKRGFTAKQILAPK